MSDCISHEALVTRRRNSGDDLLGVARIWAEERGGPSGIVDRYEEAARAPLPVETRRAVGGELMPAEDFAENTLPAIVDTLANPDAVAADASRDRLALAKNASSLEIALDTVDSIQAADGLERMLAHQLATAHVAAMTAAALMQQQMTEASRSLGASRQEAWDLASVARLGSNCPQSVPDGVSRLGQPWSRSARKRL